MAIFKSDAVKSGLMFLGTAQPGSVLCRSGRVKESSPPLTWRSWFRSPRGRWCSMSGW